MVTFDRRSAFLDLVSQDPVVSRAKLIAEPWDVGQVDSYDLGGFPAMWREWNGKYRDAMRDFWRSHPGLGEFASRFTGSSDLYGRARRRPTASVNLITVHDGFTLRDLVSYNDKHNAANRATTTPTARTTSSPGLTGLGRTRRCSRSPESWLRSARPTRCSAANGSSPARTPRTWAGTHRQGPR